jgi:hypothetical protein
MACPACGDPMDRVLMGHVDVDRCFRDEMLWFHDWSTWLCSGRRAIATSTTGCARC